MGPPLERDHEPRGIKHRQVFMATAARDRHVVRGPTETAGGDYGVHHQS